MRRGFRIGAGSRMAAALLGALGLAVGLAGPAQASNPDPPGTIYIADLANRVEVFAPGSNGNVAPVRTITGPATEIALPGDVAVDASGDVFVANIFKFGTTDEHGSITEYAPGASGNVAPIRKIEGPLTNIFQGDDMAVGPDGTIYVSDTESMPGGEGAVEVFAPGANGNVAPQRLITGPLAGMKLADGVGFDSSGTLYVDHNLQLGSGAIQAFAAGANGNVAPIRTIEGPLTGLAPNESYVNGIVAGFGGELFVSLQSGSLKVFPAGANGNVAPTRSISGPLTTMAAQSIDDLAVAYDTTMYVSDFGNASILSFGPTANGNVAPTTRIAGPLTGLSQPEGVALALPPITARLTTSTRDTVGLGGTTFDQAILSGGNAPTGTLRFRLYGPADPTCNGAPVFTSPLIPVSGNGSYSSPSFLPPVSGTYRWVVEYSGDEANAPAAGACGDSGEQTEVFNDGPPETHLSTTLSSPGISGARITVPDGVAVSDQAALTGANAATATGTVQYELYSDSRCEFPLEDAGQVTLIGGTIPPSSALSLPPGTYYWRASYSGDVNNLGSQSVCGSEVQKVNEPPSHWYQAGTILQAGHPQLLKTSGTMTVTLYGRESITCTLRDRETIENPVGGEAGVASVSEFTLKKCTVISLNICSRGEKLELNPVNLPWTGALRTGPPITDELAGLQVNVECKRAKTGTKRVYDVLTGTLNPEIARDALEFGGAAGELSETLGLGRGSITGTDTLKGPKHEAITAAAP